MTEVLFTTLDFADPAKTPPLKKRPTDRTLLDHVRGSYMGMKEKWPEKSEAISLLKRSRSFVCTNEFTEAAARLSMTSGERMLELARHSRAPHAPMMIEWNARTRRDALMAVGSKVKPPMDGLPEPDKAGFMVMLSEPDIYSAVMFTDEQAMQVPMMPFAYKFSPTGAPIDLGRDDIELNRRIEERYGDEMPWTSQYLRGLDTATRRKLTSMIRVIWSPGMGEGVCEWLKKNPHKWDKMLDVVAREQGGDARWLFTLLGMINVCEAKVSEPVIPKERTFLQNRKVIPHTSFQTLDIVVGPGKDRVKYVERALNVIITHKRRHQVRGHFRHYANGKEVWIKPHLRGDENLGWVVKTYNVTTAEDRQAEYDDAPV